MNELFDYGRPGKIELAALVDRGERQLPIAAQYVGATLSVPAGKLLRLARASAANSSCDSPMRNPQLNGDGKAPALLTIEGLRARSSCTS